jgi:4-hydroxybenzoate polyprenyltransferase/phosphoserine phosphatase
MSAEIPLVVDLDGTLIRSDLLPEAALAFLRAHPLQVWKLPIWLFQGKAVLKENLARNTELDASVLPYRREILALIEEERKKGRAIVLATASHRSFAERVAAHLDCFDAVLATEGGLNLVGAKKRDALLARYGERGFDYAGDSSDDLPVWAVANRAYVVGASRHVESLAQKAGNVKYVPADARGGLDCLKLWFKALRWHQWMKNLLVFAPIFAAHRLGDVGALTQAALAFALFSLCASSVYLTNDLLDLSDDRHHPTKRGRPFAAGSLSLWQGIGAAPVLLFAAFAFALLCQPLAFTGVLAGYAILTLTYSLVLKRLMAFDVIALSILYSLRIFAGAAATGIPLSFWALLFSTFIFLSLALVKRHAELGRERDQGKVEKTRGRGYYPKDLEMISALGAAAGYLSVMVLALYIHDPGTVVFYRRPEIIWLACPLLLFWMTRVWLLTHRREMHDDPVVFALRDRVSRIVGLLFCAVFWIAL